MTSIKLKRFAVGSALLAGTSFAGGAAFAQGAYYPPGAMVQSLAEDPASALRRHLRDLNSSPRSLTSLLGAGQAALDLGDPQAALTFFARAEEVAPRDGRVKAGMGSAFVQTEQAQPALRFFAEAVAYGAPLSSFAKDRGLAYDMIGDPARAQADYTLALQRGSDAEVERRMALSKAISGDQRGALAMLDPQLRRGDRAGWRARAFVLALTGDAAGAVQAARSAMPAQAGAMGPFFARLPQLSAADRAMAVHFGRFPANWQASANANVTYAQNQAALPTLAGRPDPSQPALGAASPPAAAPGPAARSNQPAPQARQRPAPASRPRFRERWEPYEPRSKRTAPATARSAPATVPAPAQPVIAQPQPQPQPPPQPQVWQPGFGAPGPSASAATPPPFASQTAPPQAAWAQPVQTYTLPPAAPPQVQAPPFQTAPVQAPVAQTSPSGSFGFDDVVATVQSLPAGTAAPAARPVQVAEASRPRPPAAKPAAEKRPEPATPKEPSRVWVQLAVAQDKNAFPGEFRRLKGKAAKLLDGKSAWTAPMGRTNRLLVGPFTTEKEAREFVNQLAKEQIESFSWVSDEGQKVDKLPAR